MAHWSNASRLMSGHGYRPAAFGGANGRSKCCPAETTLREKVTAERSFPRYRHLFGLNFA